MEARVTDTAAMEQAIKDATARLLSLMSDDPDYQQLLSNFNLDQGALTVEQPYSSLEVS